MKLICDKEHQSKLTDILKDYQHLDVTLIEQGMLSNNVGIYFNYNDLDELIKFLNKNFIRKDIDTLVGAIDDKIYIININDITYVEGLNKDTYIYTFDNSYKINSKLYQLEEQLLPKKFIRISKSIVVNINKIKYITPSFNGRLILNFEKEIVLEVSRVYSTNFKKTIGMR